jgi:tRNA (guanine37-N1)-methyltransferase
MRIDIITTFPEMFAPLEVSIIGKARERELISIRYINPRDFTRDPHHKTDDTQYGGSEGMVMMAPPLMEAVESIMEYPADGSERLLLTSPQGKVFTQQKARELSELKHLIVVCGHYKGIDERFIDLFQPEEISLGDYVLTGGEIPAMAFVDAIVRLLPDVVGGYGSVEEDSLYAGLLDCPRYTKPREVRGLEVPSVLLGGNHARIREWRRRMAMEATRRKRPDLLAKWEGAK